MGEVGGKRVRDRVFSFFLWIQAIITRRMFGVCDIQ